MKCIGVIGLVCLFVPGIFGAEAEVKGEALKVNFVNPYTKARDLAKEKNRLFFVKPVYGGMNKEGAADYRCGTW